MTDDVNDETPDDTSSTSSDDAPNAQVTDEQSINLDAAADAAAGPAAPVRRFGVFSRLYHGETRADIVGRWKLWFAVSGLVILVGAIALGTRGLNLGIDFTGGTVWQVPSGKAKVTDIRNAMGGLGYKDAVVTEITSSTGQKSGCPCMRVIAEASSSPAKATTAALKATETQLSSFIATLPTGVRPGFNTALSGLQAVKGPFAKPVPADLTQIGGDITQGIKNLKAASTDPAKTAAALGTASAIQHHVDALTTLQAAEITRVGHAVSARLAQLTGSNVTAVTVDTVGPSWGKQISTKAEDALIVFLIVITLYITLRFEFRMAVATLAALVHDLLVVVGIYALFGFPVTPATVIAILTILGFSIYDGIVVFDRVDENTALVGKKSRITYTQMANQSLNQVMMRSLNTSITALLPILSILVIGALLLGATTLEEFGLALFIGLMSGAYSSIFIATPILALLKEREPRYKAVRERIAAAATAATEQAASGLGAVAVTGVPVDLALGPPGSAPRPRKPGKKR